MLACARVRPAFVLARLHSSSLQLCTRGGSRLQQSEVAQFCSNLSCIDVSCYMSATRKLNASAILRVKVPAGLKVYVACDSSFTYSVVVDKGYPDRHGYKLLRCVCVCVCV